MRVCRGTASNRRLSIMATISFSAAAGRQCALVMATCRGSMFLLLVVLSGGILPVLSDTSFDFPSFTNSMSLLTMMNDTMVDVNGTLLLNSVAASSNPGLASKARVFYGNPVELYDNVTNRFASFYTTATLSILTGQDSCWGADGMAFVISSASSPSFMGAECGGYLGILNSSNNGQSSNQIVAVEIDTAQNLEFSDPSSCHMAVLTNSMAHDPASNFSDYCAHQNSTWCADSCIQFSTLHKFVLEILYDGVYLHGRLTSVNTGDVWFDFTQKLDLTTVFHATNELFVGFSGSTHSSCAETHKIHSWSFTATSPTVSSPGQSPLASPPIPQIIGSMSPLAAAGPVDMKGAPKVSDGVGKRDQAVAAILGGVCTIVAVGVIVLAVCLARRCLKSRSVKDSSSSKSKPHNTKESDKLPELELPVGVSLHGLRRFTYQELSSATNKFAPEELLGRGGFGWVYKGKLVDTGELVAVKMISPEKFQHGGEKEFLSEVSIISLVHHRNLVKLQGCCYDRSNMLLVYDYMANGSLDRLLVRKKPGFVGAEELSMSSDSSTFTSKKDHLTWDVRFRIVNAIAGALSYLHEECGQCILHRDVKPSNVLLDSNFNAYLADFGLARLFDHDRMAPTMTCGGTPGYIAPEIFQSGRFTTKSDVYSFGVLALEVACGRRPIEPEFPASEVVLLDWVWEAHEAEDLSTVVDPCLGFEYDESEMKRLLQVGLLCCIVDPAARISMMAARNMLLGTKAIELPETKPEVQYTSRRKGDPKSFNTQGNSTNGLYSSSGTSSSVTSISQLDGVEKPAPR